MGSIASRVQILRDQFLRTKNDFMRLILNDSALDILINEKNIIAENQRI